MPIGAIIGLNFQYKEITNKNKNVSIHKIITFATIIKLNLTSLI